MFKVLQHLLPRARAWTLIVNKALRRFFEGLAGWLDGVRAYIGLVFLDLLPRDTRALQEWEAQWALPRASLSEQARRDRLSGAWSALGGQDPQYIQDTLRAAGFDVYVHEWWEPVAGKAPRYTNFGFASPTPARDPLEYLTQSSGGLQPALACGNPAATCGNPAATCGNLFVSKGYPLVNKIYRSASTLVSTCGNPAATCGNPAATCGARTPYVDESIIYTIPSDTTLIRRQFLYIGAATFGDLAVVPASRRNEFERLCLKIKPAQLWLGVLVVYN